MNQRNMWPAVTIALGGLFGAGALAVFHIDRETILLLLGWLIVPVITALLAAQGAHQQGQLEQLKQQTNGSTSRLLDIVEQQGHLLAQAAPATETPPPDGGVNHGDGR